MIAALALALASNPVIYVRSTEDHPSGVPNTNYWAADGLSWDTAYTDPQSAFTKADMTAGPDVVVIAEGVYLAGGSPLQCFTVFDGTTVIGGYTVGDSWEKPTGGVTELSGEIGLRYLNEDNCYNVLTIDPRVKRVTLKNLKVSRGYGGLDGYSLFLEPELRSGGGVFYCTQHTGSPSFITLEDIWIDDCFAWRSGGGMYFHTASSDIKLDILRLRVTKCVAGSSAGGVQIYLEETSPDPDLESTIQNLSVSRCRSGAVSGGLSIEVRDAQAEITNSEVFSNTSVSSAGGLSLKAIAAFARASLVVRFCTFYNNEASNYHTGFAATSLNADLLFESCVFWSQGSQSELYAGIGVQVDSSCIRGGFPTGSGNISSNPKLGPSLIPLPISPLLDAGSLVAYPNDFFDLDGDGVLRERIPYDFYGRPRYQPSLPDIGAHERQL
jgi:hypothetical protein